MTATVDFAPLDYNDSAVIVAPPGIDRQTWLEVRRQGIGSSDAAAILGEDDWRGPVHVYLDKIDEPHDKDAGEAAEWGEILEDVVARHFAKKTGIEVLPNPGTLANRLNRFQMANLDRVTGDGGALEIKTTHFMKRDDWAEGETPARVFVQVQHQLAVSGLPFSHVAVLIGGQQFRHLTVERDEEFIGNLTDIETRFWEQVQERRVPEVDGLAETTRLLERMYGCTPGASVSLDPLAFFPLRDAYWSAHADLKAAEDRKTETGNRIRALLGDAEIGLIDGKQAVTWKQGTRAGYVVEPTTTRTLRPGKP